MIGVLNYNSEEGKVRVTFKEVTANHKELCREGLVPRWESVQGAPRDQCGWCRMSKRSELGDGGPRSGWVPSLVHP